MKLKEYLVEKEAVTSEIMAYSSREGTGDSAKGKLVCTPFRVVYINGKDVTDISLRGVNSIEYSEKGYPMEYFGWGILFAFLSAFFIAAGAIGPISEGILFAIGILSLVGGIGLLIYGAILQRSQLKIHTPNKTYSFYATEEGLAEIGHTVRGYEMKS
ncbi:hypothetical protein GRS48_05485 [Halorubrum sp. JWXQ-INN 858]|uniref:hypothetical protein n=1 Tax=Halorubrum sp. JWXQ-INN 858 TaxID=2690782 RepID=UPI0013569C10|nr:hypothetical protein [Halorubrum sp. JWXQ-INN 858]MWV64278.1 hypothetical protein [Halorubrum sp. JWXQ-INN 858]